MSTTTTTTQYLNDGSVRLEMPSGDAGGPRTIVLAPGVFETAARDLGYEPGTTPRRWDSRWYQGIDDATEKALTALLAAHDLELNDLMRIETIGTQAFAVVRELDGNGKLRVGGDNELITHRVGLGPHPEIFR